MTPFSGCDLALLNWLPVIPEHNSLRGATYVWRDGSLRGVGQERGLGRNLQTSATLSEDLDTGDTRRVDFSIP